MNYLNKIKINKLNEILKVKELYYEGNLSLLDKKIIAIVGSRKVSAYTRSLTSSLASKLKARDIVVISGAALGVDGIAHKASFPNTIAVMANGLDIIYPKTNEQIIKDIKTKSLALSEYDYNVYARGYHFIQRNRIVVGLADAVVIAQASLNSGSMSSANYAIKLNKPLYVFPQRIHESEGTNKLLAQKKANLIHDIDEFCNSFISINNNKDEVLEFCAKNPSLDICLEKFGTKIYEYELEGKILINGENITIL